MKEIFKKYLSVKTLYEVKCKEQKFKEEWEAARQRTQEFKNELMQVEVY
jgi:hypothetical protein